MQAMMKMKNVAHNNFKDVPCQRRWHSSNSLHNSFVIVIKHNSYPKL